ncbi:disease resistance protein RFL1-like isoform X2 [Euphorbia lathyris]
MHEAWSFLMDEQTGPVAICGAGGIGKTTLMRKLYNKLVSTQHFETLIWITVSSNSTPVNIQDAISKRIRLFDAKWVKKSFAEKAQIMENKLREKKFVLFLDDVWNKVNLSLLGVPNFGWHRENKLVFTTRSTVVADHMSAHLILEMGVLSTEEAWELFRYKVGDVILSSNLSISELSRIFVSKCQGLPIFLCTLGRAMTSRKTRQEWSDALVEIQRLESTDPQENSLLQFCFESLPNHLIKCCLMYFSLFPEDFNILKNDLIDFWICEHLFDEEDDTGDYTLDLGYNATQTLCGAGLLEEEDDDYVKLQDMIRDFASSVAIKSQIFENAQLIEATPENLVTHVGWPSTMGKFIQNLPNISHDFSTFLLNHNPFLMIKPQLLQQLEIGQLQSTWQPFDDLIQQPFEILRDKEGKFYEFINVLTVLDLSYSVIEEVLLEISKLVSLQCLNLSHTWIDRLPIELKLLTKLKCLNLEYDDQLRVIPWELISCLSSLQVLKIFRCGYSVEELEDNILLVRNMDVEPLLCLEHLKVLSITITSDYALYKVLNNPKFLSCTQSLSLEILWGSKSLDILRLSAMKNLLTLEIHQAEVLEELNDNLMHSKFLSERSFKRLEKITLEQCSNLRELTWVILAPNLKVLRVKSCERIENIISIAQLDKILKDGQNLEPFAQLEILALESLPKLNCIYWKALPFQYLKKSK